MSTHQVTLLPHQLTFEVSDEQTVLDGALAAGINFPHRCQVGACAMCLCKKQSGEIDYQLEPMLTEEEQEQGWMFTCQAVATTDLVIKLEQ